MTKNKISRVAPRGLASATLLLSGLGSACASQVTEAAPVTASIVMVHLQDGTARHESLGNGFDGAVTLAPLDLRAAAAPASYSIQSADDAAYQRARVPASVGRKTKGREFVKNGGKFEWVPEHWIFLRLTAPMQDGKSYSLTLANGLVTGVQQFTWRYCSNWVVQLGGSNYAALTVIS